MILTRTDKKILEYLYHNQRESYTKIAKKLNLTRTQVEYTIKKYIESGIIKNFITFFDTTKLGYNQPMVLLVKLKNRKEQLNFIESIPKENLQSYGKVLNKYDLYLTLLFKDVIDMNQKLSTLIFQDCIQEYKIMIIYEGIMYPLKFMSLKTKENPFDFSTKKKQKIKLSEKDKQILHLLKHNGRIKIVDIAKQTGISSELILYKIRKWQQDKLILGNKTFFNLSKLGYSYTVIFLHIHNLSKENKQKIMQIAKNNNNVTAFGFMLNEPNCYFNLTHKKHEEIKEILNTINNTFEDEQIKIEIIYLEEEEYYNILPFI